MSGGPSWDLDVSPDAMRWTSEPPPPKPFRSRRDGRFNYSFDAIEHIEETSCSRGCRHGARPGTPDYKEFGPGGTCGILAQVAIGDDEPIPELDDQGAQVICLVREPVSDVAPVPEPPKHRSPTPVRGQLDLFGGVA